MIWHKISSIFWNSGHFGGMIEPGEADSISELANIDSRLIPDMDYFIDIQRLPRNSHGAAEYVTRRKSGFLRMVLE